MVSVVDDDDEEEEEDEDEDEEEEDDEDEEEEDESPAWAFFADEEEATEASWVNENIAVQYSTLVMAK